MKRLLISASLAASAILPSAAHAQAIPSAVIAVVDLDKVSFMDSSGLHVLIAHACVNGDQERVRLTRGSAQVRRVFDLVGVSNRLAFV